MSILKHLIVFGRIPDMNIPAKTRLGKEIGDEMKARKIGHDLTKKTLEKFSGEFSGVKNVKKYFCYGGVPQLRSGTTNEDSVEAITHRQLQEEFSDYIFFPQPDSDKKDVRGIHEAFQKIILEENSVPRLRSGSSEPFKIILVGTDIMGLTPEIIADCFDALSHFDACIVPVEDLGYGLVGISKNIDIISEITNFDSRTDGYNLVQETKELCTKKNISLFVHPQTCYDIDTEEDAKRAGLL